MQIAGQLGTPSQAGAATMGHPPVPDVNRNVSEVHIRLLDRDDRTTFTTHQQLVTGGHVGALAGYATLAEAISILRDATMGSRRSAVAVLERDGRYFGHLLKGRDLEAGLRAPLRAMFLETDDHTEVIALRASSRIDRLRALVDGSWVRRFRP